MIGTEVFGRGLTQSSTLRHRLGSSQGMSTTVTFRAHTTLRDPTGSGSASGRSPAVGPELPAGHEFVGRRRRSSSPAPTGPSLQRLRGTRDPRRVSRCRPRRRGSRAVLFESDWRCRLHRLLEKSRLERCARSARSVERLSSRLAPGLRRGASPQPAGATIMSATGASRRVPAQASWSTRSWARRVSIPFECFFTHTRPKR